MQAGISNKRKERKKLLREVTVKTGLKQKG